MASQEKRKLTAKDIYDLLVNKEKLIGGTGKIIFNLKDVSVTVKSRDAIGNLIQDWLGGWLSKNEIIFEPPSSSQEFPDFFLDPDNHLTSLLEVKSFDFERSPNFDIANFESYCRSLKEHSYRLDADYIIFGYSMNSEGTIRIERIWLKKIWEISGSSGPYPAKIQQKQNVIYNLRPTVWYSAGKKTHNPFNSKGEFVKALYDTLMKYPKTKGYSAGWLEEVKQNYLSHTGKDVFSG